MDFALPGIFAAGVLSFGTPCVLPLVPVYLAALVGGDLRLVGEVPRRTLVGRAILFSVGFGSVFALLGLGAGGLGAVLQDHRGLAQAVGALLIALFGLRFLGLVRIPLLDRTVRADGRRMESRLAWVNALVLGVVFAAGWSPCVGPVLGAVLTYTASQTADPATGALYLSVYAAGFAVPIILTAALAQHGVGLIRRAGRLLPIVERATGVVLLLGALGLAVDAARTPAPTAAGEALEAVVPQGSPAMVEFYAESCPVCERMAPVVEGLRSQCTGEGVTVRQIDVSTGPNRPLVSAHRLVGVPTFVFLDAAGAEVARLVGEQEGSALRQALAAARGAPCPGVGPLPAPPRGQHGAACGLEADAVCGAT